MSIRTKLQRKANDAFHCNNCNKVYSRLDSLRRHEKSVHKFFTTRKNRKFIFDEIKPDNNTCTQNDVLDLCTKSAFLGDGSCAGRLNEESCASLQQNVLKYSPTSHKNVCCPKQELATPIIHKRVAALRRECNYTRKWVKTKHKVKPLKISSVMISQTMLNKHPRTSESGKELIVTKSNIQGSDNGKDYNGVFKMPSDKNYHQLSYASNTDNKKAQNNQFIQNNDIHKIKSKVVKKVKKSPSMQSKDYGVTDVTHLHKSEINNNGLERNAELDTLSAENIDTKFDVTSANSDHVPHYDLSKLSIDKACTYVNSSGTGTSTNEQNTIIGYSTDNVLLEKDTVDSTLPHFEQLLAYLKQRRQTH